MSTVVAARVSAEDAALFQRQAARHGVSTSHALGALIRTAVAVERDAEQARTHIADGTISESDRRER
jgi:hypothetical protein